MNNLAPPYLSEAIDIYKPARALRSSSAPKLEQPRTKTQSYGGRTLNSAAATLWNNLSIDIRTTKDYNSFKKKIKTVLFKEAYNL